jgi:hypothetical protein
MRLSIYAPPIELRAEAEEGVDLCSTNMHWEQRKPIYAVQPDLGGKTEKRESKYYPPVSSMNGGSNQKPQSHVAWNRRGKQHSSAFNFNIVVFCSRSDVFLATHA